MPRTALSKASIETFVTLESARSSQRAGVDTSALTDTLNRLLPSIRASVAAQQTTPMPVFPDVQNAMRDAQRAATLLRKRMHRPALHKDFTQVQSRLISEYEEQILNALGGGRLLVGVIQENPAQIRALFQQHPRLLKMVTDAVAGLREEFGDVSFRADADETEYIVLAAQTYREDVADVLSQLDEFEERFWQSRKESQRLLVITVEFLARDSAEVS